MIILKVAWIVTNSLKDKFISFVIKYMIGSCIKGMKYNQSGIVLFIKGYTIMCRRIFKRAVNDSTSYLIIHFMIVFLGDTFR